jgi:hypothetical protein
MSGELVEQTFPGAQWTGSSHRHRSIARELMLDHDTEQFLGAAKPDVVMRVLGDFDIDSRPDIAIRKAHPGDRWLLCSDGLCGVLEDSTLEEVLSTCADQEECAQRLVSMALRAGSTDNVTAVIADATLALELIFGRYPVEHRALARPEDDALDDLRQEFIEAGEVVRHSQVGSRRVLLDAALHEVVVEVVPGAAHQVLTEMRDARVAFKLSATVALEAKDPKLRVLRCEHETLRVVDCRDLHASPLQRLVDASCQSVNALLQSVHDRDFASAEK